MTGVVRRSRAWIPAAALLVAALVVSVAPRLPMGASAALLTTSATAGSNTATAGTCSVGSKSWTASGNGSLNDSAVFPSSTHVSFNRFDGPSSVSSDQWMSPTSWTATTGTNAPTYGAAGALYCDADTAITMTTNASYVATPSVSASTLGMASTTTNLVLMLWFKTMASGSLASASDANNNDRELWIDSSGKLRFSGRSGNPNTSWTTTATGASVNDGTWHFAVAVMTPASVTSGGVSLYLDGAFLVSDLAETLPYRAYTGNVQWSVGDTLSKNGGPSGAATQGAVGTYDEFVLLATSSLTAAQVLTLYKSADL